MKLPKFSTKLVGIFLLFLVLFFASIFFGYNYFKQNQNSEGDKDKVISQVEKLVLLPEGEEPTVATVSDVSKLISQPFFAKAANGDKVLIYQNAKKAILYRPSLGRVIEIGPVSGEASSSAAPILNDQKTEQTYKLAIYNGTTTAGLAKKIEGKVKEKISSEQTVILGNAQKNDYQKTIVIDVSGQRNTDAKNVADSIGAEVGSKPDGETFADADFVIIVGADAI